MVDQWTSEIIAKMHTHCILKRDLAQKLGFSPEYTGKVLNGKVHPKRAEQAFKKAVDEMIEERRTSLHDPAAN